MEKMKYIIYIWLVCLMPFLHACSNDKKEQLLSDSIEQTWQQSETALPEAQVRAEKLCDSVRTASKYVRKKYDLLTIRLRDKHDIPPSSPDSALQTASYFASHGDEVDKERAYYYLGSAYRDLKDYPRAVNHFLMAVDAARQSKCADTLIWQNALAQLRNLYMLQLCYEDELNVALQAVELAEQSGMNQGWYLTDVASAYNHLHDTLHCLQYCDLSFQTIQREHFPEKYNKILAYMLATYSKYSHFDKIDTLLQHLMQLPEDQRPQNYELSMAMCHENANVLDSAILHYKAYYNKAKTIAGRYEASAGLQRCYRQKRDFEQATEWGCCLYDTNDSIIYQRAFEETQRVRDSYVYYRNKEKEHDIVQRDERIIFISVTSCLALLSIALGLLLLYNYRKKKFMEEIIGRDRLLMEQSKELNQKKMINRELTQMALMSYASDNAENVIAHFRKVAVGQERLGENSWKDLMNAIETLYPGFLEAVEERLLGNLREPLLRTICLLKIGMKLAQIANVMDASRQTVWNRVKRAETTCGDLLSRPSPTLRPPLTPP